VAVYALGLFSQVAATPLGEGMDVDGHLAYVVFMVREGRWPLTGEPAMPADVAALRAHGLASDYVWPGSYARWARLTPTERQRERVLWLAPRPDAPYVSDNYEAQHPPLYYALAYLIARPARSLPYDQQLFRLSVLSVGLSALGLPALWLVFRRRFSAEASAAVLLAVAWFPNLMPFVGRVTNDALAFPIACWFLWLVDRPRLSPGHAVAGALLLVVGMFAKTYFLVFVPVFLAACALRGGGAGRPAWRTCGVGAAVLAAGLWPLVAVNLATTGLALPVYEARLTAGLPLSQKLLALVEIRWPLFLTLLARGAFWSGYWSWVAPGPWYYLPAAAPLLLLLPANGRARPGSGASPRQWWRTAAADAWIHWALLGAFLLAMCGHAALLALDARLKGRVQFLGGEGWYLNVLLGCTATLLAVAVRERYGPRAFSRIAVGCAGFMVVWNLLARVTLYAFWGGSVRLWSGLRFARLPDVAAAVLDPDRWRAWQSWPGVVGPWWLVQALPLAAALVLTVVVLRRADVGPGRRPECTM
jgi:hypothetical protein